MADEKFTAGQAAVNAAAPVMRSVAGPAFSAALETIMQTKAEKRAQKFYKENQRQLYEYGQMAQRNAVKNQVEGLRQAGFSPVMATGAAGMNVSAASMPQSAPHAQPVAPQSAIVQGQMQLMAAQADLIHEQARGEEIKNDNMEGANYTYNLAFDEMMRVMKADAEAMHDQVTLNIIDCLQKATPELIRTKGDWDALREVANMLQTSPALVADRIHNMFQGAIDYAQANNPTIASAFIIQPLLENDKTRGLITQLAADTALMQTEADKNRELIPKIKEETKELGERIKNYFAERNALTAEGYLKLTEAEKIHNSDVASAMVNGDWDIVAANAAIGTAEIGKELITTAGKKKVGGNTYTIGTDDKPFDAMNPADIQKTSLGGAKSAPPHDKEFEKNFKRYYNGEVPEGSVINGKPYYKDKSGNWQPYEKKRRR